MKPRHDVDTSESAETTETQAPRLDHRFHEEYRGMTSGNRFWIQIAATIISPLVVAAVLWLSTSLSNMATKTDLERIEKRMATKIELNSVEKRIEGVEKRFDGIEKRFDGIEKRFEKRFEEIEKRMDNMATKTDLDRVEKKIEEQTERIDRLLLHLVPKTRDAP